MKFILKCNIRVMQTNSEITMLELNPDQIIDDFFNSINKLFNDVVRNIDNINFNLPNQNSQNSQDNKSDKETEFNDMNMNFSGVLYDVYYELLIMKDQGQLSGFTINEFNYPCYFDISIDGLPHKIRITSIYREYRMIYSALLFNNKVLKNSVLGYNHEYKNHNNINSIISELYRVKELLLK